MWRRKGKEAKSQNVSSSERLSGVGEISHYIILGVWKGKKENTDTIGQALLL